MEPRTIAYNARSRWSEAQRQHHSRHLRGALVALLDRGPCTARDVAETTGLSRVTANTLLHELAELGLAQLAGLRRRSTGPQARIFAVRPAALRFAVAVFRPGQLVTASGRSPDLLAPATAVDTGRHPDLDLIAHALAEATGADEPRHVVVALPAGECREQTERNLTKRLGCSVTVRPHADLAALAEATVGAARAASDFLLVTGDEAGVKHVVDGVVRHGAHGRAGAWGPLTDWVTRTSGAGSDEALLAAVTASCLVTDPSLVVLTEETRTLARPLTDALGELLPAPPPVTVSTVGGDPVLHGALHLAARTVRSDLLRRTSDDRPPLNLAAVSTS